MKKKMQLLISVFMISFIVGQILCPIVQVKAMEINIITNGGFESDLTGWHKYTSDSSSISVEVETNDKMNGDKCIRFSNISPKTAIGSVYQNLNVDGQEGRVINLNFGVKTINFNGDFQIKTTYYNSQNLIIGTEIANKIYLVENSDWYLKNYKLLIPNYDDIKYVKLSFVSNKCEGDIYLDDISAYMVDNDEINKVIKNSGFENDYSNWSIFVNNGSKITTDITNTTSKTGNNSLLMSNKTGENTNLSAVVTQKIDVSGQEGKVIKLNTYIKSENFLGNFQIMVNYYDALDNEITEKVKENIFISENSDWSLNEKKINIPNDSNIVSAKVKFIYESGQGTIYLDDISAEFVEDIDEKYILKNGGFEECNLNWWDWSSNSTIKMNFDTNIVHSGKYSLKIDNNNDETVNYSIFQKIKLDKYYINKTLNISQFIKSENLSAKKACVTIKFFNSEMKEIQPSQMLYLNLTSCKDWSEVKGNIIIPNDENIEYMNLYYDFNNFKGTVWIDDVNIQESSEEENINIFQNGNFETTLNGIADLWFFHNQSEDLKYSIDSVEKAEGANSLKITSNSYKNTSRIIRYINDTERLLGKNLKLIEKIKSNVDVKFSLKISYQDEYDNDIKKPEVYNFQIYESDAWNEYTNIIKIPENDEIKSIKIEYLGNEFLGDFWIDDVRCESYVKIESIKNISSLELSVGEVKNFEFSIVPDNATFKKCKIESSNPEIVKVNENNQLIAMKNGIVKIKVIAMYDNSTYEFPAIVADNTSNLINNIPLKSTQGECISGKVNSNCKDGEKYSVFIEGNEGYINLKEDGSFNYYVKDDANSYGNFSIKIEDINGNESIINYNLEILSKETLNINKLSIVGNENENINDKFKILSGSKLIYSINEAPKNGILSLEKNGTYSYIPTTAFSGYDFAKINVENQNGDVSVVECMIYIAPSINTLKSKVLSNNHPSSIIGKEDIEKIKLLIETNKTAKDYFDVLKTRRERYDLYTDVIEYDNTYNHGQGLNTNSISIIQDFSFLYKITNDSKYAERAKKELLNICDYPNWNENHLLDTADLARGAAIGYDWLYDYLTDSEKEIVKNAIIEKALKKELELSQKYRWFDDSESNWGIVCNSGFIFAALTIADESNFNITLPIVNNSLKNISKSLSLLYEDGSSIEGPTYWRYATSSLMYVNTVVKNLLDIKEPFSEIVDYSGMEDYLLYSYSNNGYFNYSDSENAVFINGELGLWLGKINNSSKAVKYARTIWNKENYSSPFNLIWYIPELDTECEEWDLDKYFDKKQVVFMKSEFDSNNMTYVGFKGGVTGEAHGDLDIGTFVYDILGVRWAIDLGIETYTSDSVFNRDMFGVRWKYYRKKAEGHNTLVIGDSMFSDQVVGSKSNMKEVNLNIEEPYVILDMTPAYKDKAANIERKLQLINNRKNLVIEDNFTLKQCEEVSWQMHTKSEIEIISDTKAILRQDGKEIIAMLYSDCGAKFSVEEAKSKEISPLIATEVSNDGIKKLVAKSNAKSGVIKVVLGPSIEENFTIKTFEADKQSPQKVGSKVKLTANISGAYGTEEYKFYRYLNGKYGLIRDWNKLNSITIAPNTCGKYDIYVAVRNEKGEIIRKNIQFTFEEDFGIKTFEADKQSPQKVGSKVKLTANISGAYGTEEYKFYRYLNGKYGLIRDWNNLNSITIAPSTCGKYDIYVAVRNEKGETVRKNIEFIFN